MKIDLANSISDTGIGDYESVSYHCSLCHGEHVRGTTYICSPLSGMNFKTCPICNPTDDRKRFCPYCGHNL